jgi:thioredoxin:protein disulfide reductase
MSRVERVEKSVLGSGLLRPVPVALFAALAAALVAFDARAADGGFSAALDRGPLYAALAAFGGGLLVALTPCVYPMIAVTVSVFGAKTAASRWQGMLLSAAFVLGIVATFVPLGMVAGLTGGVFGTLLSNRWVILGLSGLFLALAASMFGAFALDLPSSLKNRLAGMGGSGIWGAVVLGMICGPIAAPCTGPFLTGLLAWIAKTQSAALGGALMACFALGLGVPFFLVGAFAMQLPKSGRWMLQIKSAMGIVLLVLALYFMTNAFPGLAALAQPSRTFMLGALAVALVGLGFGAVHKSFEGTAWPVKISKGIGVVLTAGGGYLALMSLLKPATSLEWAAAVAGPGQATLTEQARAQALTERKPLLVDFTASWCVACKKMEKGTFTDERVRKEAERFLALRVDATDDTDPKVEATLKQLAVRGLPTLILFASNGNEAQRFDDAVPPDVLYQALKAVD